MSGGRPDDTHLCPRCQRTAAAIREAVAEEREACAQIADAHDESAGDVGIDTGRLWRSVGARSIAKAIRAARP